MKMRKSKKAESGCVARLLVRKEVAGGILGTFRHLLVMGITNIKFSRIIETFREAKKITCFENISRFRGYATFLSPDLESTQDSASYMHFFSS